jgi:23S rRNA pseudouridine1911/1915/1917 synthase
VTDERMHHVEVSEVLDGLRLDRAVAIVAECSRSEAHDLVDGGMVTLDGEVATKPSLVLRVGQVMAVRVPAAPPVLVPDASVPVEVVFADEDVIVVNKSARLVVHPGSGQRDGTLVAGLLSRFPDLGRLAEMGLSPPERPGIVHRLDKGTSGLMVVARSPRALEALSKQLATRDMGRTYLGMLVGWLDDDRGVVDAPLGRSERDPTRRAIRVDGKSARTAYHVLRRLRQPRDLTLGEFRLETGRTHQIRVHLASLGHPVVNDTRYGHHRDPALEADRLFLHASEVRFTHPNSDEVMVFASDLPADLASYLAGTAE